MSSDNFSLTIAHGTEIVIPNIGGDLVVEGKEGNELRIKGDELKISTDTSQPNGRITIHAGGDCRVRLPENALLRVGNVGGDSKITNVLNMVKVQNIGGDLVLRDLNAVQVQDIGGDLEIKRIVGSAEIMNIGGDARFLDIHGDLQVKNIGGEALLHFVYGNCEIADTGGDLVLNMNFYAERTYRFNTSGNVLIRAMDDASVRFVLPLDTEIEIDAPHVRSQTTDDNEIVTIGEGVSTVVFENIDGDFELVNSDSMDTMGFESGFPDDFDEIVNARISEQISSMRDQMQRHAENIRREAQRTVEQIKSKIPKRTTWEFNWEWNDQKAKRSAPEANWGWQDKTKRSAPPTNEPVSDQERLTILRMLENKQITVEEAERLLAALEGR